MDVLKENQKDQLIAALQELAQQSEAKSKRARLSEIFEEVEAILAQGVTQKRVTAALAKKGLVFTPRSFETTYARIKKKRMDRKSEQGNITHNNTPRPKPVSVTAALNATSPKKTATAIEDVKAALTVTDVDPADFE